jgi:DNA-binding transcriptional ArsR family regulator
MPTEDAAHRQAPQPLRQLTDPKTMRAVAHPTRLALLEALFLHEQLTATEASEIIGESPTNCAFHLRTLAKYGFVEEAGEAPGRRRPWRRRHVGFSFTDVHDDPETAHAAGALTRLLEETWFNRARVGLAARARYPRAWQEATGSSESVAYLTPEEAQQLSADIFELLTRYRDRLEDPRRRPGGSLPIEYLLFSFPLPTAVPEG